MLLNYANTLIVETNGLLYILCVFICEVIIIIVIVIIIIIIIIYLFILEQLRYQTTELNRHLRRRLLTWLIVRLCFFFFTGANKHEIV